jgi:hypothetical protein
VPCHEKGARDEKGEDQEVDAQQGNASGSGEERASQGARGQHRPALHGGDVRLLPLPDLLGPERETAAVGARLWRNERREPGPGDRRRGAS